MSMFATNCVDWRMIHVLIVEMFLLGLLHLLLLLLLLCIIRVSSTLQLHVVVVLFVDFVAASGPPLHMKLQADYHLVNVKNHQQFHSI